MVNVAAEAPAANQRLSMTCMTKINNVMEAYNARLAALVTNKDGTRKLRLLSPMDYFSGKSNL